MKHLKIFETGTAFNAEKSNLESPWVVLTEDDKNVHMMESGEPTPTYEYVDLGLPSGLKWAKCNIGATSETDYGLYFQWGATEGYTAEQIEKGEKVFDWANYKYYNGTDNSMTKYGTVDGKSQLEAEDDAAIQNLRSQPGHENARMPKTDEYQTLKDNTYWQWVDSGTDVVVKVINDDGTIEAKTVQYPAGYFVYKVKDDTHKGQTSEAAISALYDYNYHPADGASSEKEADVHIFFPASGYASGTGVYYRGSDGYYWSSSLYASYSGNGLGLRFYSGGIYPQDYYYRYYGFCVRSVSET